MSAAAGAVLSLALLAFGSFFAMSKIFDTSSLTPNDETTLDANIVEVIDPDGPEVQFVLFTRNNTPYPLRYEKQEALNLSTLDQNYPIKIITHGFMSSIKNDVFSLSKNAYLEIGNFNIIGMDWSALCHTEYVSAMRGAKIAGQQLGDFLNYLASSGINLENVHIIGHSLGAHVAGIGGSSVIGKRVGRITGLDPAGPGYRDIKEELRLDSQDALLVDVIHTFMKVIGTAKPIGHIDFYPNGGRYQPGCPDLASLKLTDGIFCNHGRSFELFAESIRSPKAFKSRRCKSVDDALYSRCLKETEVYFGDSKTYKNGLYYFKTRHQYPYSMESTNNTGNK